MTDDEKLVVHSGGCHCGRVRFETDAPEDIVVSECNCSLCGMTAYLHLIVRKERFRLLSGSRDIATYTFNSGVAQHYFCRHCGIKSYYVPRSNPDGISVNARCIDAGSVRSTRIEPFDGRNWEQNAARLSHLTD